jgi:hypothetical protein
VPLEQRVLVVKMAVEAQGQRVRRGVLGVAVVPFSARFRRLIPRLQRPGLGHSRRPRLQGRQQDWPAFWFLGPPDFHWCPRSQRLRRSRPWWRRPGGDGRSGGLSSWRLSASPSLFPQMAPLGLPGVPVAQQNGDFARGDVVNQLSMLGTVSRRRPWGVQ